MDSIGGYEPLDLGSNPGALAISMKEHKTNKSKTIRRKRK